MADLADSAVQILDTWEGGGTTSKRWAYREVILTLTGQGDATDTITAGNLRLRKVRGSTPLIKDDNGTAYLAAPSYDNSLLLLFEDNSDAPSVQTGTFKCTVWGDS